MTTFTRNTTAVSRQDAKTPRKSESRKAFASPFLRVFAPLREARVFAFAVAMTLPLAAQAHKGWLAPSKTVLDVDQWITVDAGVSTEPFVRDHNPLRLDALTITAPDGSTVAPENAATGKLRSTFDLQLTQAGTYRIAVLNEGLMASWDEDGKPKRWRGPPASFASEVPAKAKGLKVSETRGRVETFATAGTPNDGALKPTGKGLELVPVSGIADLFVGEDATFRFLLDGKPAAHLDVDLIRDGTRYRNAIGEQHLKTDAEGLIKLSWTAPGLHWISASVSDNKASLPQATERRASYTATVEVLSP